MKRSKNLPHISLLGIAPRTRLILALVAVIGLVVVFTASLDSGQAQSIGTDKIIHFTGYMILASVFSLVLRPVLLAPGLLSLAGFGIAIEYLQPFFNRGFEIADMKANGLGILTGAILGLGFRGIHFYISKEIASSRAKRSMRRFRAGERILGQGDHLRKLYIVYQGTARLTRETDGKTVDFGTVGPGDAIGVLGLIRGESQYTTVIAEEDGIMYSMSLDELMESAGGPEQPASAVLRVLSNALVLVGDRLVEFETGRSPAS
jgi:CRP-like cAMP-binding protein